MISYNNRSQIFNRKSLANKKKTSSCQNHLRCEKQTQPQPKITFKLNTAFTDVYSRCQFIEAVEAKATPVTMNRFTTLTVRFIKRYLSTRKQQWSKPSCWGCVLNQPHVVKLRHQ